MPQDALDIVEELYRRYGAGDLGFVLEALGDDIAWTSVGPAERLPWAGTRRGRSEVEAYFRMLGETVAVEGYEVERFIAQGEWVAVLCRVTVRHLASGRVAAYDKVDILQVRDGRVVAFREYFDTATAVQQIGPP